MPVSYLHKLPVAYVAHGKEEFQHVCMIIIAICEDLDLFPPGMVLYFPEVIYNEEACILDNFHLAFTLGPLSNGECREQIGRTLHCCVYLCIAFLRFISASSSNRLELSSHCSYSGCLGPEMRITISTTPEKMRKIPASST